MPEQENATKEVLDSLEPDFKDSDEELVRKVDLEISSASSLFQADFLKECKEADAFFDADQVNRKERRDYQSDTVLNRLFPIIRNLVGFLTDNRPKGDIVAAKSDNPDQQAINDQRAEKVNDALDYHAQYRLDLQGMLTIGGYDLLLKRDAYLIWYWDKNGGQYGDIGSEVARPEDVYVVDPTPGSIQEKAVIYRPLKHRSWIKTRYPEHYARIIAKAPAESDKKEGIIEKVKQAFSGSKDDKQQDYYRVDNYWSADNTWYCVKIGKVVVERGKNPYFESRTQEEQLAEAVKQGTLQPDETGNVSEEMIQQAGWKPVSNFLDAPRKPIVRIPSYLKSDQFHSRSAFLQAKAPQLAYNKRSQQIEDNLNLMANGQWLLDPEKVTRQEAEKVTNEPGLIVMLPPGSAEKVSGVAMPDQVFKDRETYSQHMDLIFGQHDISRGASDRQQPVGTSQILQESDRTNIRLLSRNIEQAVEELYQGWVQLMKLFYTTNHYVLKYGTDGAALIQEINQNDIDDGINVLVKIGSGFPDQIDRRTESLELWKAQAIDPLSLFRALDYPNADEMAQRLVNWQGQHILSDQEQPSPQSAEQSIGLAEQENQAFLAGQVPELTPDEMLSPEHTQVHEALMESADAKQMPQAVREALMRHVQDEQGRLGGQAQPPA